MVKNYCDQNLGGGPRKGVFGSDHNLLEEGCGNEDLSHYGFKQEENANHVGWEAVSCC